MPVMLDLFCGAGGAARGYADAGFEVIGIDLHPQPRYPFEFHRDDACNALDTLILGGRIGGRALRDFAVIHASPPCQRFSRMSNCAPGTSEKYPDLVEPVRVLLNCTGLPYVIENVEGSPLIDPVRLCGTSLGLRVRRHRLFESNMRLTGLPCKHAGYIMNPHNTVGRLRMREVFGAEYGDIEPMWRREMDVDWMSPHEAREAIPPVMTEYVGRQLLSQEMRLAA